MREQRKLVFTIHLSGLEDKARFLKPCSSLAAKVRHGEIDYWPIHNVTDVAEVMQRRLS